MYVYMYIYIYIYIYIHTYSCIYIYMYMNIYTTSLYIYIMYKCIHVYIYTCMVWQCILSIYSFIHVQIVANYADNCIRTFKRACAECRAADFNLTILIFAFKTPSIHPLLSLTFSLSSTSAFFMSSCCVYSASYSKLPSTRLL